MVLCCADVDRIVTKGVEFVVGFRREKTTEMRTRSVAKRRKRGYEVNSIQGPGYQ